MAQQGRIIGIRPAFKASIMGLATCAQAYVNSPGGRRSWGIPLQNEAEERDFASYLRAGDTIVMMFGGNSDRVLCGLLPRVKELGIKVVRIRKPALRAHFAITGNDASEVMTVVYRFPPPKTPFVEMTEAAFRAVERKYGPKPQQGRLFDRPSS